MTWASPRFWSREALDEPKSGAFDDADRSFNARSRSAESAASALKLVNGASIKDNGPGQVARSNIQAGTSSERSVSDSVNVQRKAMPSALSIAS
jgi:hypothetical protein